MSTKSLSTQNLVLGTGIILALAASGCCLGGSSTPIDPAVFAPTVAAPGTAVAVAAVGAQALTLAPGFSPDPTTVSLVPGGPVSANSMQNADAYCPGNISAVANVVLTTTGPIAGLRLLTRGTEDTTLMLRLSDGRVFCDDDSGGGRNAAILADVPAGTHQVFVGTYFDGAGTPATLGFTVNAGLQGDSLP